MKLNEAPMGLEQLTTPILICNGKGIVIFKNTAAVKSVRLPRRNTSMLSHLGQTEQGELMQLPDRKKPSILSVYTGDRCARALVMPYQRKGEQCSLWVFAALLQTGSASSVFAEMDGVLCSVGREICEYVKAADELALALPEQPDRAKLNRMERRLYRIADELVKDQGGYLFELEQVLQLLRSAIENPLQNYGCRLHFTGDYPAEMSENALGQGESEPKKEKLRELIDVQSFFSVYLHLVLFCCECGNGLTRQVEVNHFREGEDYFMETSFSLPYPPFFTDNDPCDDPYRSDLGLLAALSPRNRFEILLMEAFSGQRGYEMRYAITHEAENNVHLRVKLPIVRKTRLRSGSENAAEWLFVQHDLTLYFWYYLEERLRGRKKK